ncbi:MAG TPA: enoyl-CoA hydratase-related protein [Acidimicrobiia bacterium]|nr:enoyl-CoA hydratase-related protein [Acidimicrobiia bacterium]
MVRYEVSEGRATITIDDPERRNPMSTEAMAGLLDRTREAMADPDVRVIVYTGAGDRAFSAGGDLSGGFVDDPIGLHRSRGALANLFREMARGGKPTVARVNGHALAGGFGLAVACDFVICVDEAKLGTPEIDVGLWPMMISAVLLRAMPFKAVLDLMLTGRIIDPAEALRLGAVTRVVTRDELDTAVDELVDTLAAKSPAVIELGRDSLYAVVDMGFDESLARLQAGLTAVSLTEDSREGVQAFLEKRDPSWSGR